MAMEQKSIGFLNQTNKIIKKTLKLIWEYQLTGTKAAEKKW